MHRTFRVLNIPTDIIRTFVAIADAGSFTSAADKLGLSQPGISAQMKRLQSLIGGPLFQKAAGVSAQLTDRGQLILTQARKLLDANDQMLSIGGGANGSDILRVGVSPLFIEAFFAALDGDLIDRRSTYIQSEPSNELVRMLSDGFLDIIGAFDVRAEGLIRLFSWEEPYIWVKSARFVARPGAPIPIICNPGQAFDQPAIAALEHNGIPYRVVFATGDTLARFVAVEAGVGISASLGRAIPSGLMAATDYYLPKLDSRTIGIFTRPGSNPSRLTSIVNAFKSLANKNVAAYKAITTDDPIAINGGVSEIYQP